MTGEELVAASIDIVLKMLTKTGERLDTIRDGGKVKGECFLFLVFVYLVFVLEQKMLVHVYRLRGRCQ